MWLAQTTVGKDYAHCSDIARTKPILLYHTLCLPASISVGKYLQTKIIIVWDRECGDIDTDKKYIE